MTQRYRELIAARAALEEQIERARNEERSKALTTIKELMREFAISVGELTAKRGPKKAGPLPPKFRDPATGNTWSGRGKPPHWIAGKDRQSFAI